MKAVVPSYRSSPANPHMDPIRPKEADVLLTFEPCCQEATTRLYERFHAELDGVDRSYRLKGVEPIHVRVDGEKRSWTDHCARRFAEAIGATVYIVDPAESTWRALLDPIHGVPGARSITSETDAVVLTGTNVFRLAIEPFDDKDDESRPNTGHDAIDVTIRYTGTGAGRDEWSVDADDLTSVETVTHTTEALIPDWKRWPKLIAKTANHWELVDVKVLDAKDDVIVERTVSSRDGLLSAIRGIEY
jgi:hypothetical protein